MAELALGLGLTHSRMSFPAPAVPKLDVAHAMLDAGPGERSAAEPGTFCIEPASE